MTVLNNVLILLTGMLYRIAVNILLLFWLAACAVPGFYEPITLDLEVPDGPPAFQAGWRGGCRTGLAIGARAFTNGFVYDPDFGTGAYQHDPDFLLGWGNGWFSCVIHANMVTAYYPMRKGPLE